MSATMIFLGASHVGAQNYWEGERLIERASLLRRQMRFAEMAPLQEQALAIFEATLGRDHPKVAKTLDELAFVYTQLGRLTESMELSKRAVGIVEMAQGPE